MEPTFKAPGTKRLKLKHDKPVSSLAFEFNLRHFNLEEEESPLPRKQWHPTVHHHLEVEPARH
jgi:hypothetical protein